MGTLHASLRIVYNLRLQFEYISSMAMRERLYNLYVAHRRGHISIALDFMHNIVHISQSSIILNLNLN